MMLMTLLKRCYRFKGFVYQSARFAEVGHKAVEVQVRARSGWRPYCSGCGRRCVGYDRLRERRFEFIPANECNARNAARWRSCYRGPKANTRSQTLTCSSRRTGRGNGRRRWRWRAAFTPAGRTSFRLIVARGLVIHLVAAVDLVDLPQPIRCDDLLAPLRSVRLRTADRLAARPSGQFVMKAPFSHQGTGWTIARKFAVVPAGTRT